MSDARSIKRLRPHMSRRWPDARNAASSMAAQWEPIETLTDVFGLYADEVILVWNQCDGLDTVWLAHTNTDQVIASGCYTHWMRGPKGPEPLGVPHGIGRDLPVSHKPHQLGDGRRHAAGSCEAGSTNERPPSR